MSRMPRTAGDAALCLAVGGAVVVSRIVPEQAWGPLTRALAWTEVILRPGTGSLPIDASLARESGSSPRDAAVERIASGAASRLSGLRKYGRAPRAYPIDVSGAPHITQALAGGRGAVLWIGRFTWASLISKVGLHRAGFSVTHLSRPEHGFGSSAFAVTRLNPIWTRIEERFLQERVVMAPGDETAALRALRRRLGANGIVSISVGSQGAQTVAVPFLGTELRLATGPVSLSLASGAPLLPVFVVHDASRGLLVAIDSPLDLPDAGARGRRHQDAAAAYARRLEPWVRRYSGQWLG
jgi:lauroyl/myristoyl acyltransferase